MLWWHPRGCANGVTVDLVMAGPDGYKSSSGPNASNPQPDRVVKEKHRTCILNVLGELQVRTSGDRAPTQILFARGTSSRLRYMGS